MGQVTVTAFVAEQTQKLATKLYLKNYFSYKEDAEAYVKRLKLFMESIPTQRHYPTKLPKYGKFYARYKPNKHTTYYITFDKQNDQFLIKNIISNHTPQYPRYIKGLK